MYNRPWNDGYFNQPFISGVEHPRAIVKQAYYDSAKEVLAVTLLPGEPSGIHTSFAVNQLNKAKVYSIKKDGKLVGRLKKGALEPVSSMKGIEYTKEGILKISTGLDHVQTFLIQAEA